MEDLSKVDLVPQCLQVPSEEPFFFCLFFFFNPENSWILQRFSDVRTDLK